MIYNILAQRCTKFRQRDRAILGQFIFRKIGLSLFGVGEWVGGVVVLVG